MHFGGWISIETINIKTMLKPMGLFDERGRREVLSYDVNSADY